MNLNASLEDLLFKRCYSIDENTIRLLDQVDNGHINNVIVGLEDECFGISLTEESPSITYSLFYIHSKKNLTGLLVEMDVDLPERDQLTFLFAQLLAQDYPHLDTIDVFNTFQRQTRTLLEKLGYFTFCPSELENVKEGQHFTMLAVGKTGIKKIPSIDKLDFYKKLLGCIATPNHAGKEDYVYLMLNLESGYVKIGRSIHPVYREKTLQGQEPKIHTIAAWKAPKCKEKELHTIFDRQRVRGEWFKLSLSDLKKIKAFMNEFY